MDYSFIVKGYNSGTEMEEMHRGGTGKGTALPCLSKNANLPDPHVFTNPAALQILAFKMDGQKSPHT